MRTVLVTGASRGIGRSLVTELSNNYNVVGTYNNNKFSIDNVFCIKCDIKDEDSVKSAIAETKDKYNNIDILIANAGITRDMLTMRMSQLDFDDVINTNLRGTFLSIKHAMRDMISNKFGRIVIISSVVGFYGSAGQINYASSKSGLLGMARSLVREVGNRNITVNVVAPGFIETDMTDKLPDKVKEKILQQIPVQRYGLSEDVVSLVKYLILDNTSYITGTLIPVDGGLSMGI